MKVFVEKNKTIQEIVDLDNFCSGDNLFFQRSLATNKWWYVKTKTVMCSMEFCWTKEDLKM